MAENYDIVIIGYGPAGITAGIYAARKKLSVALIGATPGGEVLNSGDIENWPGAGETDGTALTKQFVDHLKLHEDEVDVHTQTIVSVTKDEAGGFTVTDEAGATYSGTTVIYAAGRHPRMLKIPGEEEFKNKGVSYCATCDAPLFPDKTVAIVGGGNTGAEAVIMFQKIAKKIYLLHIDDTLPADSILVDNFKDDPKVEIIYQATTTKIEGEAMVTGLVYTDDHGKEKKLALDGVFVAIGAIPNTAPIKDLVKLDTYGAIVADRYGLTNVEGFFAAGDVTDIRDAQIVVAAGQGCSAALSAGDYLSRTKQNN